MPESNNSANPLPAAPLIFHPDDWEGTLKDEVLRVISSVGENCELGLKIVNRDLRDGLLEVALLASDLTMTLLSRTDWEHRTVFAAPKPAEGVGVTPYEPGSYFARRRSEPAARAEESMPEPAPAVEPEPPPPEPAPDTGADPRPKQPTPTPDPTPDAKPNLGGRDPEHAWEDVALRVDELTKDKKLLRHPNGKPNIADGVKAVLGCFEKHEPEPHPTPDSARRWIKQNWSRVSKWWGDET